MKEFFCCDITVILHGFWEIFSIFNGNPDLTYTQNTYGIRFCMGLFFSFLLFQIIKMRTLKTMLKQHIVALIASLIFFIRYFVMLIFEWGYQIGIYNDPIIHFLFPPIEHYFYMIGFVCFAYYSLKHYDYFPGILKNILYFIPLFLTSFFIYATIQWKIFFYEGIYELPAKIYKYKDCVVDWQSHLIFSIICLYVLIIALGHIKNKNNYLLAFWFLSFVEHFSRTISFYNNFEPGWLATIFHAFQLWTIPILILHFIKMYIIKLSKCETCYFYIRNPL